MYVQLCKTKESKPSYEEKIFEEGCFIIQVKSKPIKEKHSKKIPANLHPYLKTFHRLCTHMNYF